MRGSAGSPARAWLFAPSTAVVVALLVGLSASPATAEAGPRADCLQTEEALTYWRAVREEVSGNELPADELALELIDCLGASNAELRDRIGYEVLTYWLRGDHVSDDTRRSLLTALSANVQNASAERITNCSRAASMSCEASNRAY